MGYRLEFACFVIIIATILFLFILICSFIMIKSCSALT